MPERLIVNFKSSKPYMRIVSTSYSKTASFKDPCKWLERISFYTGLLEELAKQNEVISIERISYTGEVKQKGVRYLFVKQEKEVERFPTEIHKIIREISPDIIFINGFIFPFQLIQLRFSVGSHPKIIVLNRAEKPGQGLKKLLQKFCDRFVTAYFFAAKEDGIKWEKAGIIKDESKIKEIVQASSDLVKISKPIARKALNIIGDPLFLWVGRLDQNKDPLTVISAFIKYHFSNSAARLYMIYQEDKLLEEVEKLVHHADLAGNIILAGTVEHQKLNEWYSAADFILSASHSEGSGIAVMEAMSCGCIPLVTSIPSFKKMTLNGRLGMLFQPGNGEELHTLLLKTASVEIEKESSEVSEHFNNELSFTSIAKKINSIIAE
jgi:glycosyltransferase involved in cell wall biosynthesis